MHDGMTFDTIEGQGQGHSKVAKCPFSKSISSAVCDLIFEISSDSDNMEQYLNLAGPVF